MKIVKASQLLLAHEPSTVDASKSKRRGTPWRPRIEVFSVYFKSHDGDYPISDLYGAITVVDSSGVQDIYKVNGGDHYDAPSSNLNPGGLKELVLTGPNRNIDVLDGFRILMRLTKKESDLYPDNDIISSCYPWALARRWKGLHWNPFSLRHAYDKLVHFVQEGDFGTVILKYVVFSFAVGAMLEVMLINNGGGGSDDGEENNPADVYGRITARNSSFMDHESVLFRKKKSDTGFHVKAGQLIPLLRSAVAVPVKSSLIVSGDLRDCNRVSPNDEIANFSVEFTAPFDNISEVKKFSGLYGGIQVKVTWEII